MNTMETINNIEVNEVVEQAMEVVSATPKISWKKFGVGALVVGAVGAAGYGIYRFVSSKKNKGEEQACESVDNVEIAKRDFLDEESEEE